MDLASDDNQSMTNAADTARWKILVVDDDPEFQRKIYQSLANFAYKQQSVAVLHAQSFTEANACLSKHSDLSLVLVNETLESDEAGLKVARRIRSELKNDRVRIVFFTEQNGSTSEQDAIQNYGINECRSKPEMTAERLHSIVQASLSTYETVVELATTNQQLEELNEEMAHFSFAASHELQTPLRAIARFAQLIDRDYTRVLDATGKDYLKFIVSGVKTMETLIQDLLDLSGGSREWQALKPVDCNVVLREAYKRLAGVIYSRSANIEIAEMPMVMGHERDLTRLFQNLIDNALKYQPGHRPSVKVWAERVGDDWKFFVKDKGIGIDPAYHLAVFKPFKRLHSADEYPGNGVGLALCSRVMRRYGRRVELDSRLGEGAIFSLSLPAAD